MDNVITKRVIGNTFGIAAGVIFSISAFGLNALIQTQNHLYLSGLVFLISLLIFTGLTYFSSLITVRSNSARTGALVWFASGIIVGLMTTLLPLYFYPKVVMWTVPEAAGWFKYAWQADQNFVLFFCVLLSAICFLMIGLLENNLVDSTYFSNTLGVLIFNTLIIAVFMGVIGSVVDSMVNKKLREAASGLNFTIDYAQHHDIDTVSKETRRNLRLAAVTDIKDTLSQEHTIYVYEQNMGYETTNFLYRADETWANCFVFGDKLSNCFLVSPPKE